MPLLVLYLLKLSLSLAVVFLFYHFILERLTFYTANRYYLLGYTALSFVIPFINIAPFIEKQSWQDNAVVNFIPVIHYRSAAVDTHVESTDIGVWNIVLLTILAGVMLVFCRLIVQLFSFRRMKRKATLLQAGKLNLYQVDEKIIPFSFGKSIFINRHQHSPGELEEIILHEFVHVRQKHSLDILWGEFIFLVNWFNPFAWWLKKAIRQNLEFIADRQVLRQGYDRKQYQYLLLKVVGNSQFSIATQFNFSSLKTRIAMMNKTKSAKKQLLRMLFLLPATAVMLLAFRNQWERKDSQVNNPHVSGLLQIPKSIAVDTVPDQHFSNSKGYMIDIVDRNGEKVVRVSDKNGKRIEEVALRTWKESASYRNKYGDILMPPPPPVPPTVPGDLREAPAPPLPPAAPVVGSDVIAEVITSAPVRGTNASGGHEIVTLATTRPVSNHAIVVDGNVRTTALPSGISSTVVGASSPYVLTDIAVNNHPAVIAGSGGKGYGSSNDDIEAPANVVFAVTIKAKTTRAQLDQFVTEAKAKGVTLVFDHVEYNNAGEIISLGGMMNYGDNRNTFITTDFVIVTLSVHKSPTKCYLRMISQDKNEVI